MANCCFLGVGFIEIFPKVLMIQKHEVSNVGKLIFIQLNNVSEEKFVSAFFNIKETLNAGRTRFSVINDEGLWT